jgi:hypothetical protein
MVKSSSNQWRDGDAVEEEAQCCCDDLRNHGPVLRAADEYIESLMNPTD